MIWPAQNVYLTRKTDDAAVAAADDDELTHLSYADDCLALLNACVIDYGFCIWIKDNKKYFHVRKNIGNHVFFLSSFQNYFFFSSAIFFLSIFFYTHL